MEATPDLLRAVFDPKTGQVFVAHPEEDGVFVLPSHYQDLVAGEGHSAEKSIEHSNQAGVNCTYTERSVCNRYYQTPSGPICVEPMTIRTCNCT